MSVLDSLLRFIDPIEFRKVKEERRRKRQAQPPGADDDLDVAMPAERPQHAGAPLVCRVCGYSGGPEHKFCPRCLAETMERRR
jgi:rubrerythrin